MLKRFSLPLTAAIGMGFVLDKSWRLRRYRKKNFFLDQQQLTSLKAGETVTSKKRGVENFKLHPVVDTIAPKKKRVVVIGAGIVGVS